MSKYTTEVRFICETAIGLTESKGYNSVNYVISKAIPKVFDFDFPIFDEKYRDVLCGKILKHYYTREICEETVGLWKLRLDARLNEIMPYFNQLYKSELLSFNPLVDVEITRTGKRDNNSDKNTTADTNTNGTSNVTSNTQNSSNSTNRDLYSDTPQGALTNVENEEYLTNARKNTTDDTSHTDNTSNGTSTSKSNYTGTDKITSTEDYLESVKGKQGSGSYSKLLKEYRDTFLNIDKQVIESLSDLFFGLW